MVNTGFRAEIAVVRRFMQNGRNSQSATRVNVENPSGVTRSMLGMLQSKHFRFFVKLGK